jgi:hypothetical protein
MLYCKNHNTNVKSPDCASVDYKFKFLSMLSRQFFHDENRRRVGEDNRLVDSIWLQA